LNNGDWTTKAIVSGETVDTYKARDLMRMIADSAYICGDPGMQYDTTVNRWHTSKNTAPINASNPCSEYMFLDDSACNLASLNLLKFADADGGFAINRKPLLDVMRMHRDSVKRINRNNIPAEMYDAAWSVWSDAVDLGVLHGYRNAQASVLAPTGTIGFMMDCDTTGIEPDLALVKYKKLVGGGTIKIVNNTVPPALRKLGYDDPQVKAIVDYVNEKGTIEGAPGLKAEHLTVFDCAFKPTNGSRSIH